MLLAVDANQVFFHHCVVPGNTQPICRLGREILVGLELHTPAQAGTGTIRSRASTAA